MARRKPPPRLSAPPPADFRPRPPVATTERMMSADDLAGWVERNVKPGAEFVVATSPYARTSGLGFWTGREPYADLDALRALHRRGVIKMVRKFWRGAVCARV